MIHLEGNNRPVAHELDTLAIEILGEIPDDLVGTCYRNGPNPRSGWSPHLFAGDGMIHAVSLPTAYRNRYVRTPLLQDPNTRRDGEFVTTANTHIIDCDARLLALEEGGCRTT
jgi:carotenoid cleavage dioxygenase-like enzyme